MEESSVMQGAQGVLVQNWPTASSAAGKSLSRYSHLRPNEKNSKAVYETKHDTNTLSLVLNQLNEVISIHVKNPTTSTTQFHRIQAKTLYILELQIAQEPVKLREK